MPPATVQLAPAPPSQEPVDGVETARQLVRSLGKIAKQGGTFTTDPQSKPYGFLGGKHLSLSQKIHANLWRFDLSPTARNVLDHMAVHQDDQAMVEVTQSQLATYFGCSQAKVSRAIGQLVHHHFTWKEKRGQYRLNPLYAYRFGSRKHIQLLNTLGPAKLAEHEIVIPPARNEATQ
ncbi:hypothetical protein [Streptomyces sp. NPDC054834]